MRDSSLPLLTKLKFVVAGVFASSAMLPSSAHAAQFDKLHAQKLMDCTVQSR
jgi:hypothetical protein